MAADPARPHQLDGHTGESGPDTPVDVPSPELVAAWLVLDALPTEHIPLWAAHWLTAGYDGPSLTELAGLRGDDPREVRDLLPQALIDCGATRPDLHRATRLHRQAEATTAFCALARYYLDGRAGEHWIIAKVAEVVEEDYDQFVTELPLARLPATLERSGLGDDCDDQLRAQVTTACREQMQHCQMTPAGLPSGGAGAFRDDHRSPIVG